MVLRKISVLIIYFVTVISCSDENSSIPTPETPIDPIEHTAVKFLALGDSYTIGQGVAEQDRWPNQLVVELEANSFDVQKLETIAQTGWRTGNLISAVQQNFPQDFNLVSLLIGVNNQFNNLDFQTFIEDFETLIQMSINIAGGSDHFFVVSIPDFGVTPFGNAWNNSEVIASELNMYNNHMMQRCAELNIPFINITEISRNLGSSEGTLAKDNLHPSGFQYSMWIEEILPEVLEILSQ